MPVFQRSKLFISVVSLTLSCLLAQSLFAQVENALDAPSPVFVNLPSIDVDSLPVPPRSLPAFGGSELNPASSENPFVEQFRQSYGVQSKSEVPRLPDTSSNLKNWRQAFDGLKLDFDQVDSKPLWNAPVTPAPAGVEATVDEPIRVAKAEKIGPKRAATAPKLKPSDRFAAPILGSSELSQNPQDTIGQLVPAIPTIPSSPTKTWDPKDFWDDSPPKPLVNSQSMATNQPAKVYQPQIDSQSTMVSEPTMMDLPPLDVDQPTTVSQPMVSNQSEVAENTLEKSQDESLVWWKKKIQTATIPGGTLQSVETNGLVFFMLKRSPRLRAVSQNPLIREQKIVEAEAEFDPVAFLRSQWQDRVDPVGDTLSVTNDGTNFLDDHIWSTDLGVRQKTTTGATVELNQRLGFRNSNSNFFSPQDQGTAALSLNVTQPLLRGRGKYYNQSQILIAQAATNASWDTLAIELQDEIQSVVESYWRLYFDRCVFLQKQMNVERAQAVLEKLEGRSELDSLPNQIARARSAVLSRKTELANARRDIRNSETDIRRLTANSDWAASQMTELLPVELPDLNIPVADLEQVITTAISNRPEIREAVKRSKIAAIQRDISVNELMPELSLLLGTYVSALQGDSQLGDAFTDQFGGVTPGYSVGVEFEMPIRNRSARSRLTQRKLQMNLIKAEIEETLQNVIAESQIARRRVASAKETLVAATEAIHAARLDLEQNQGRWESFALIEGDILEGQSPTIVLDQLLDSQARVVEAEFVYTQAEMELKISEIALQRTMGTLLTHQSVNYSRGCNDCMPSVELDVAR